MDAGHRGVRQRPGLRVLVHRAAGAARASPWACPPEVARKLALETVLGSARLAAQSGESPAALRERVTSKGGTTEAALKVFEEQKLAERFLRAVEAARDRGAELGGELAKD